ncbi:MAG: hypothetical protein JNM06_03105 [Blastocatellia bacterium]|nr:hypothetical protein [Blastocatellia bacterium]
MDIKLKKEGLAFRCEICHQSDLFDAFNNFCQRCTNLAKQADELAKTPKDLSLQYRCQVVATIVGISLLTIGLILGAAFGGFTGKVLIGHAGVVLGLFPGALLASFTMIQLAKNFSQQRKIKLVPFLAQQLEYLIKPSNS